MNQPFAFQLLSQYFKAADEAWHQIADELKNAFKVADDHSFESECPATKFILTWMRELKGFQTNFGKLFGRKKRPPSADDFTAAVALCLEQFLAAKGYQTRVFCEKTTHKKRGATRPDISIWSQVDKLIAAIECKTDFGWIRKKWKEKWEKRDNRLAEKFPACTSYLCVLTKKNWDTSEFENSPYFRERWFCLCKRSPAWLSDPIPETDIHTPIEPMFLAILTKLRELAPSTG
jgi:hypothetical protein